MNKKLTIATAALAVSTAFAGLADGVFETWIGADGSPQVLTGLDNGTKTSGYWYSYSDDADGGGSKVVWPVEPGNGYDDNALDPIVEACSGICGDAVLDKGTLEYNPFIGVGFNVVGETSETNKKPAPGDASAWGGLCITYSAEAAPSLELGLGDAVDADIGYANPAVGLSKSVNGVKKALAWSDFVQPSWYTGTTKINGTTAASQLVAVKFKIQTTPGTYHFNVAAVGPFDGTCPATMSLKAVRGASAAKAILSGRTLGFSGIKSAASAEVINLQGQVVAKGIVDNASSLNLASLDAGVYMVRVAGKAVNFSNKIVLK